MRRAAGHGRRAGAAAALALGLLAGAAAQPVLRDDRGATIALPAPPRRIVSLLPSLTESVCALGACDRLVGTDRFSNWPERVRALPKLGGLDDAQIERIAALKPDAVLVSPAARIVERLESLGLVVVVLESKSHADVHRTLALLAELLGEPAEAERVWSGIERATRAAAARIVPAQRGRRVYFEVDSTPYGAGPGSFIGETLAALGLANALPASLGAFPKLNPELVVRMQPDIVMATRQGIDEMARRPGWPALRALKLKQACAFAPDRYELLVRPGPRMGEAAAAIADCVTRLPAPR